MMRLIDNPAVAEADYAHGVKVGGYLHRDGCLPESDHNINELCRGIIQTCVQAHRDMVILVDINEGTQKETTGGAVTTFSGDYVIAKKDEELQRLLDHRLAEHKKNYQGTSWDLHVMLQPIYNRLDALGAVQLVWT